ncbi:unnamed protein product [Arctogadus glacialis]
MLLAPELSHLCSISGLSLVLSHWSLTPRGVHPLGEGAKEGEKSGVDKRTKENLPIGLSPVSLCISSVSPSRSSVTLSRRVYSGYLRVPPDSTLWSLPSLSPLPVTPAVTRSLHSGHPRGSEYPRSHGRDLPGDVQQIKVAAPRTQSLPCAKTRNTEMGYPLESEKNTPPALLAGQIYAARSDSRQTMGSVCLSSGLYTVARVCLPASARVTLDDDTVTGRQSARTLVEGGFLQGVGLFTLEELRYSPQGALLTQGPGTYKIPAFGDIPSQLVVSLLRDAPNDKAVYSSKAVGEPPLFLAASVLLALKDAVVGARSEAGLSGPCRLDSPATPERVRLACQDRFTALCPPAEPGTFQPWDVRV